MHILQTLIHQSFITPVKLLILLYANDTVLFGASVKDLQHSLSVFEEFCKELHLPVNVLKTKVLIFSNSKHKTYNFQFGGQDIDTVDE